jgi:hypothetical protein
MTRPVDAQRRRRSGINSSDGSESSEFPIVTLSLFSVFDFKSLKQIIRMVKKDPKNI